MPDQKHETALTSPGEVFDVESGELVEVSRDLAARARYIDKHIAMGFAVMCVGLKLVQDERLYLGFGASSFREYVEERRDFSHASAKRYARLGETYAGWIQDLPEGDSGGQALLEAVAGSEEVGRAAQLGKSKQHTLAKDDNRAFFDELVAEGRVTMPDGTTEVTVEEIISMTVTEMEETLGEAKLETKAYQARIREQNEKIALLESEAEARAEEIAEANVKMDDALELQERYGSKERSRQSKSNAVSMARHFATNLREQLLGHGLVLEAGDAQSIKGEAVDLIREVGAIFHQALGQHAGAIESALDTQALVDLRRLGGPEGMTAGLPTERFDEILAQDPEIQKADANDQAGSPSDDFDATAADIDAEVEETTALRRAGWGIDPDLDGAYQLKNPAAGYQTKRHEHLLEALDQAKRIQQLREEGAVPPQFRMEP